METTIVASILFSITPYITPIYHMVASISVSIIPIEFLYTIVFRV